MYKNNIKLNIIIKIKITNIFKFFLIIKILKSISHFL